MAIKLIWGLEMKLQNDSMIRLHKCLSCTSKRSLNQNNAGFGVTYLDLIQYSLFFQVKKNHWIPIPNPVIRKKA